MTERVNIEEGIKGKIIHPNWNDRRYTQFGLDLEFENRKRAETTANLIAGNISQSIKNAIRRHGFGVMNTGLKEYDLDNQWIRAHRQLSSSYWHTDWPKDHMVVLYCPPQKHERTYQTAIAGKTKVVEAIAQQMEHIEKPKLIDDFTEQRKTMAAAIRSLHENGTEYESGPNYEDATSLYYILRRLHAEPYKNNTFMNDATRKILADGSAHLHTWGHGQLLLMDGETLHTRHIPPNLKTEDYSILMRMIIEG